MLSQLRTAAPFSPAAQPEERLRRWPAIQKALEGLRLRPEAVARARAALLLLPGEAYPALDRTASFLKDAILSSSTSASAAAAAAAAAGGKGAAAAPADPRGGAKKGGGGKADAPGGKGDNGGKGGPGGGGGAAAGGAGAGGAAAREEVTFRAGQAALLELQILVRGLRSFCWCNGIKRSTPCGQGPTLRLTGRSASPRRGQGRGVAVLRSCC